MDTGISIRGGRLVRANRLKGRRLERGLAAWAAREGITLDELHSRIARFAVRAMHEGRPDDVIGAIRAEGDRLSPFLYGQHF